MSFNTNSNLLSHINKLCIEIGERHIGSEGEKKAVDYICGEFEKYGYCVKKEYYPAPGWKYGNYGIKNIDTGAEIECFPCFFSNSCDVKGNLMEITYKDVSAISDLDVKGKICFLNVPTEVGNVGNRNKIALMLDEKGASAMIVISNYPDVPNTKIVREPDIKNMGVMCVSGDAAFEIARTKNSLFHIYIDAEKFNTKTCNIVAYKEHPSNENKKKILVGAHYDTAPGIQGASDNASGTSVLLALAKSFSESQSTFLYPIEFIMFGAEEFGGKEGIPLGSKMYVESHAKELSDIKCMCNVDDVGNALGNIKLQWIYTYGISDSIKAKINSMLSEYGTEIAEKYYTGSDDKVFSNSDIPAINFCSYNDYIQIHSIKDSVERIDLDTLGECTDIIHKVITILANN